mmetsp:Transcript_4199/g.15016  ORF Transcript_4199/g.15016 Transcript_4199/m.15016 type:complete len:214 (-) Transcript_4199:685-1326(-)
MTTLLPLASSSEMAWWISSLPTTLPPGEFTRRTTALTFFIDPAFLSSLTVLELSMDLLPPLDPFRIGPFSVRRATAPSSSFPGLRDLPSFLHISPGMECRRSNVALALMASAYLGKGTLYLSSSLLVSSRSAFAFKGAAAFLASIAARSMTSLHHAMSWMSPHSFASLAVRTPLSTCFLTMAGAIPSESLMSRTHCSKMEPSRCSVASRCALV